MSSRGHNGAVHVLAWSPDGKRIASISQGLDPGLRIWDADSGRLVRTLPAPDGEQWWGSWVVFSRDSKRLFTAVPFGKMRCCDAGTGKEIWSQDPLDPNQKDGQQSLAKLHLSADGLHLFTIRLFQNCSPGPGEEAVWNAATGKREQAWAVSQASGRDEFSPDGRLRFHWNGEVYDEWTGAVRFTLSARHPLDRFGPSVGVCSPDGALFAAATEEMVPKAWSCETLCRGIQVWETATGKPVAEIPETAFGSMAFSPDGRTIAVVGEEGVRVWDALTAKEVYRRPVANRLLFWRPPMAYSPDGRRLVVGCDDTTAVVWNLPSIPRLKISGKSLTDEEQNALWADLADADAAKAYAAMDRLAERPDDAATLLRDRLRPAVGVSKDRVHRLIAALDDDDFDARENRLPTARRTCRTDRADLAPRPGRERPDGRAARPHRQGAGIDARDAADGDVARTARGAGAGVGRLGGGAIRAGTTRGRRRRRPAHPRSEGRAGPLEEGEVAAGLEKLWKSAINRGMVKKSADPPPWDRIMLDRQMRCSRRKFLASAAALTFAGGIASADGPDAPPTANRGFTPPTVEGRKPLAVVTTVYRPLSHSYHIAGRFLYGYTLAGQPHTPKFYIASLYADQTPDNDLSRDAARDFGVRTARTIADALLVDGKLAVEGVLLIGEHGNYLRNDKGQILYPRLEMMEQIAAAFRKAGRSVPVFNDKHLSYTFANARKMIGWSEELKFPLMAGSSLPVTWRRPELEGAWRRPSRKASSPATGRSRSTASTAWKHCKS